MPPKNQTIIISFINNFGHFTHTCIIMHAKQIKYEKSINDRNCAFCTFFSW